MLFEYQIINDLLNFIKQMNHLVETARLNNPLLEAEYRNIITYPNEALKKEIFDGILININIIYSSGGGEESATILNDMIEFILTKDKIINIEFIRDNNPERHQNINLNETEVCQFMEEIRTFCKAILPTYEL